MGLEAHTIAKNNKNIHIKGSSGSEVLSDFPARKMWIENGIHPNKIQYAIFQLKKSSIAYKATKGRANHLISCAYTNRAIALSNTAMMVLVTFLLCMDKDDNMDKLTRDYFFIAERSKTNIDVKNPEANNADKIVMDRFNPSFSVLSSADEITCNKGSLLISRPVVCSFNKDV